MLPINLTPLQQGGALQLEKVPNCFFFYYTQTTAKLLRWQQLSGKRHLRKKEVGMCYINTTSDTDFNQKKLK